MTHDSISPRPSHPLSTIHAQLVAPFPAGPLSNAAICDRLDTVAGPGCWFVHVYVADADAGLMAVSLTVLGIQMTGIAERGTGTWGAATDAALRAAAALFGIGRAQEMVHVPPAAHAATTQPYTAAPAPASLTNGNARVMQRPAPPADEGQQRPIVLPATDAQIKACYAIGRGAGRMDDYEIEQAADQQYGVPLSGLNRKQASEFIDWLKGGGR